MIREIVLASASALLIATSAGAVSSPGNQNFMSRHYPPGALAKGEEGQVGFSIDLTEEGRMEKCAITQSSGYPTLDRETCDFIVQYANFGAAQDSEGKKQRTTKTGFINWKLPSGVRKSTAPKMTSATLPPALVCKRIRATGSNRANATHCMTEEEWKRQDHLAREAIESMQGRIFCGDHGCG